MAFFFVRLSPKRADFPKDLSAEEGATMKAHSAFLAEQLAAGSLVVAGPVLAGQGAFGMGVFEGDSIDAVRALVAHDPANAIGTYEVSPMMSAVARAKA